MAKSYLLRVSAIFILLFILSFSFGYSIIPDVGNFTAPFFEWLSRITARIFAVKMTRSQIVSDSTAFYFAALNVFVLALVFAAAWMMIVKNKRQDLYTKEAIYIVARYYLALHLLIYGCSKLFKAQFYLPEPNILFTPLGQLHRDLLYWTTMGVSRPYNIFLGVSEMLAAVLFFSRRTTFVATIFSFFILTNVMAVNLSFDISVKLFTGFLLFLTAWLLWNDRRRIFQLFGREYGSTVLPTERTFPHSKWKALLKTMVILIFLLEALWPYMKNSHWNDDHVARPPLHGAYSVTNFVLNGDTIPALQNDPNRWKNFFIHREGYFIIQSMNDRFVDFALTTDTINHRLRISAKQNNNNFLSVNYKLGDGTISITGIIDGGKLEVDATMVDMNALPLLRPEFHWTDDQ